MADLAGSAAGRLLYDGYGGVLTSTLPVTLTGTMPAVPDAATGLVHQGGGRWYDPVLGRPLQPNATGGPPIVPQAINRYAATPVGQPGVYQVAAYVPDFWLWAQQQAIKVPVGKAIGKHFFEPRWGDVFAWGTRETGWLRVSIRAEKRLIPEAFQQLDLVARQGPGLRRRICHFTPHKAPTH